MGVRGRWTHVHTYFLQKKNLLFLLGYIRVPTRTDGAFDDQECARCFFRGKKDGRFQIMQECKLEFHWSRKNCKTTDVFLHVTKRSIRRKDFVGMTTIQQFNSMFNNCSDCSQKQIRLTDANGLCFLEIFVSREYF